MPKKEESTSTFSQVTKELKEAAPTDADLMISKLMHMITFNNDYGIYLDFLNRRVSTLEGKTLELLRKIKDMPKSEEKLGYFAITVDKCMPSQTDLESLLGKESDDLIDTRLRQYIELKYQQVTNDESAILQEFPREVLLVELVLGGGNLLTSTTYLQLVQTILRDEGEGLEDLIDKLQREVDGDFFYYLILLRLYADRCQNNTFLKLFEKQCLGSPEPARYEESWDGKKLYAEIKPRKLMFGVKTLKPKSDEKGVDITSPKKGVRAKDKRNSCGIL